MIYLDYDDLIVVATRVIGSPPVVRDQGLLEAAAFRPRATAFGSDAYPTLWSKSAALMESLARSHPLVDGNKRLALGSVIVMLGMNGHRLTMTNDQAYDFTIAAATGQFEDVATMADVLERSAIPR